VAVTVDVVAASALVAGVVEFVVLLLLLLLLLLALGLRLYDLNIAKIPPLVVVVVVSATGATTGATTGTKGSSYPSFMMRGFKHCVVGA
jgi:hypothetical protein